VSGLAEFWSAAKHLSVGIVPRRSAPSYITDELCQVADVEARQRLRSSSSSSLIVSRTRHSTVGDRAFPVAAARVWNSLPDSCLTFPTSVIVQCLRSDSSCFGHYNRSCLLTYLQQTIVQPMSEDD